MDVWEESPGNKESRTLSMVDAIRLKEDGREVMAKVTENNRLSCKRLGKGEKVG